MTSPYLDERKDLITKLNLIYPYGIRWFESKPNHVLIALYNKKRSNKNVQNQMCKKS